MSFNTLSSASTASVPQNAGRLLAHFQRVRDFTEHLASPLVVEDYVVQSMSDVSPTKWHLAHTTWFFETFLLSRFKPDFRPFHPQYAFLFNSYYVQAGPRHCRAQRGYLSRPTVEEVYRYRAYVDQEVGEFIASAGADAPAEALSVLELGIHHEQQHQELILTDIKHVLSVNPLRPAYREVEDGETRPGGSMRWIAFEGGLFEIGHEGPGFAFDNESPRHKAVLEPFVIGSRPVTNGEYLAFMDDGGYGRSELWLSLGYATVQAKQWSAPFYWENIEGAWHAFTLGGSKPLNLAEPVCHLSYFEADAFARWAGARLPTEAEWEVAALSVPVEGNFADSGACHPRPATPVEGPMPDQFFGDVWEWTSGSYGPYPGYRPLPGALGEYNGKFMCNQYVLRGGSCATPASHIRRTYRNFFPPDATWQFMGLRLANDQNAA